MYKNASNDEWKDDHWMEIDSPWIKSPSCVCLCDGTSIFMASYISPSEGKAADLCLLKDRQTKADWERISNSIPNSVFIDCTQKQNNNNIHLIFQSHSRSTHGSELAFVFGVPLQPEIWRHVAHSFTEQEAQLSMQVMTYWTNFAKTG